MQYPLRFRGISRFLAFHPIIMDRPKTQQEIQSPRLAEIQLNNQPLFAFLGDIEKRAQRMDQSNR